MRSIDDQIKFQMLKAGWHINDTKIEIEEDRIEDVEILVTALDNGALAHYAHGKIFLSKALVWFASLAQRRLVILHEYAHAILDLDGLSHHETEYACDEWALQSMIESGSYSVRELKNAIALFGEVVDEEESRTHPSSKNRYKRLLRQLKEQVV
jgi:hypothetical protein